MTAVVEDFCWILLTLLMPTDDLGATFLWYLVPTVVIVAGRKCVGGDVVDFDTASDVVFDRWRVRVIDYSVTINTSECV